MKSLRIKTLARKQGGVEVLHPVDDTGWGSGGGGYTCGGSTQGTCPPGYYCVCYQYNDWSGCTLEMIIKGYCKFISCECI